MSNGYSNGNRLASRAITALSIISVFCICAGIVVAFHQGNAGSIVAIATGSVGGIVAIVLRYSDTGHDKEEK